MARHRTANADSGSSRTQLIHPSPFRRRESSLSSSEGAQPPLRPLHLRHHNAARDLSRAAAPQLSGRGRSQRTANGRRQRRRRSSAIGPACHRRRTRAARNRGRPHDQLRTRYQSFAATAGGSGRRERQAGQRRRVDRPPAWGVAEDAAILQGHKHEAGSVARVPALEIERRVAEAARAASSVYDRQRSIGWQSGPGGAIGPGARSDLPARLRAVDHDANLRTAVEVNRIAGLGSLDADDQGRQALRHQTERKARRIDLIVIVRFSPTLPCILCCRSGPTGLV
jgi:hypothetical protein